MRKPFFRKLTWTTAIGVLLASYIPHVFSNYWIADLFSNFKFQFLLISIVLILPVLYLFEKKFPALLFLGIGILWNAYFIVPYYVKTETPIPGKCIKIISINLLSSNTHEDLVLAYITRESPDILILLELTPDWMQKLSPIFGIYDAKETNPRSDNFGIALLSKFQMKSAIDFFGLNNKPSIVSHISIENERFTIVATHPIPPVSQIAFENRNQQLLNIIHNRHRFSENLIIAGDFNTSSFSSHFNRLISNDLKDSRMGFGILPTWPSRLKIFQTTLDHFLVSDHLKVIERNTGPNIGSDHLPIRLIVGVD